MVKCCVVCLPNIEPASPFAIAVANRINLLLLLPNSSGSSSPTPGKVAKEKEKEKEKGGEVREKESLTPEELQQQQQRERELLERIQKAAACTYILPLGRDRFYRRYWLFPSTGALFVEDDFFGVTEDMLLPQKPSPEGDAETQQTPQQPQQQQPQVEKMETDEVKTEEEEGEEEAMPPKEEAEAETVAQRCGPPVNRPNQWAFYGSLAEVEELLEALNSRGHRESSLKEALQQEKERMAQLLDGTTAQRLNLTGEMRQGRPPFLILLPYCGSLRAGTDCFILMVSSLKGYFAFLPVTYKCFSAFFFFKLLH